MWVSVGTVSGATVGVANEVVAHVGVANECVTRGAGQ